MRHSSRLWLLLLPMLSAITLIGCETPDRAGNGSEPRRTGHLVDPVDVQRLGYTVNWITTVDVSRGQHLASVDLLDNLIVSIESPRNLVSAVSLSDGQVRWRQVIGRPREAMFRPTRLNGLIYINSTSQMFALDARDGRIVSTMDLPVAVSAPHTLVDGKAVFGSVSGRVFAMDLETGQVQWNRQLDGRFTAAPADGGDVTVVADETGRYAMYDMSEGEQIWAGRTFDHNAITPVIDDNAVYIASHDQTIYALDRETGRDLWTYRDTVAFEADLFLLNGTLYVPLPSLRELLAIDAAEGSVRWHFDDVAIPLATAHADRLLLISPTRMHLVRTHDGQIVEHTPTDRLATAIGGPGHSVVLVSGDGRMVRLNRRR